MPYGLLIDALIKFISKVSANKYIFEGYSDWPAADMDNPNAYNWFKNNLNVFVNMGVKGYKIDRGAEGEMPHSEQNKNVLLFQKMAYEGLSEVNGDDQFIFSRNTFDRSRRYAGLLNGDTYSDFEGLTVSIKNALRSGFINFPMFGSDIGGYIGTPSKELFARWLEFGTYCTFMEIPQRKGRIIWDNYDRELLDIAVKQCRDHHELIPYTRSYLYNAKETGVPVIQALILKYPDDDELEDLWDEYLYGNEILVAPVYSEGSVKRSVYLPDGKWLFYNDKKSIFKGNNSYDVPAPIREIPLFIKEGSIIPRGDILKANNNWVDEWEPGLRIEFFPSPKIESSFEYYTGKKAEKISALFSGNDLTIKFNNLENDGILEIYLKKYSQIIMNNKLLVADRDFSYDPIKKVLTIGFYGSVNLVIRDAEGIFQ